MLKVRTTAPEDAGSIKGDGNFVLQQWRWNISGAEQEELNFDEAKDKTNKVVSGFLNVKVKIQRAVIL